MYRQVINVGKVGKVGKVVEVVKVVKVVKVVRSPSFIANEHPTVELSFIVVENTLFEVLVVVLT